MGRWMERQCNYCRAPIAYLPEWSHIPEYCKACQEWQEKPCLNPHCGGKVRYKVYWTNIRDYCDCKGWYTVKCDHCYSPMQVHCNWDNPPKYCERCRSWQEKACANPHCSGRVSYKEYWDNKPKYCTCKGWYEKNCENSHCNGTIRVHSDWNNPPKFCSCKGFYESACGNPNCRNKVSNHCDWRNPKSFCDHCFKMSKRSAAQLCEGNYLEEFLSGSKGIRVRDSKYGDNYRHVVIFVDGGHVSGDVCIFSTECLDFHQTLEQYDDKGNRKGKIVW